MKGKRNKLCSPLGTSGGLGKKPDLLNLSAFFII